MAEDKESKGARTIFTEPSPFEWSHRQKRAEIDLARQMVSVTVEEDESTADEAEPNATGETTVHTVPVDEWPEGKLVANAEAMSELPAAQTPEEELIAASRELLAS